MDEKSAGSLPRMQDWSVEQVCQWLTSIERDSEVVEEFRRHKISGFALFNLEERHFERMQSIMIGDQIIILNKRNEILSKVKAEMAALQDCCPNQHHALMKDCSHTLLSCSANKNISKPEEQDTPISAAESKTNLVCLGEQNNHSVANLTQLLKQDQINKGPSNINVISNTALPVEAVCVLETPIMDGITSCNVSEKTEPDCTLSLKDRQDTQEMHGRPNQVLGKTNDSFLGKTVSQNRDTCTILDMESNTENSQLKLTASLTYDPDKLLGQNSQSVDCEMIHTLSEFTVSNNTTETLDNKDCVAEALMENDLKMTGSLDGELQLHPLSRDKTSSPRQSLEMLKPDSKVMSIYKTSDSTNVNTVPILQTSTDYQHMKLESEKVTELTGQEDRQQISKDYTVTMLNSQECTSGCLKDYSKSGQHSSTSLADPVQRNDKVSDFTSSETLAKSVEVDRCATGVNQSIILEDKETSRTRVRELCSDNEKVTKSNNCSNEIIVDRSKALGLESGVKQNLTAFETRINMDVNDGKTACALDLTLPENRNSPEIASSVVLQCEGIPSNPVISQHQHFRTVQELREFKKKRKALQAARTLLNAPAKASSESTENPVKQSTEKSIQDFVPEVKCPATLGFRQKRTNSETLDCRGVKPLSQHDNNSEQFQASSELCKTEKFNQFHCKTNEVVKSNLKMEMPNLSNESESQPVTEMQSSSVPQKEESQSEKSAEREIPIKEAVSIMKENKIEMQDQTVQITSTKLDLHACTKSELQTTESVADKPHSLRQNDSSTQCNSVNFKEVSTCTKSSEQKQNVVTLVGKNVPQNVSAESIAAKLNARETRETKPVLSEILRKIGKPAEITFKYKKGAKVSTNEGYTDRNLLCPIHHFVAVTDLSDKTSLIEFSRKVLQFASACLNDRVNGIIHFGISSGNCNSMMAYGEIVGIPLHRASKDYHDFLRKAIRKCFNEGQIEVVSKCIIGPEFIETVSATGPQDNTLFVIEVDVVPHYQFCNEELFYVKLPKKKKVPTATLR